MKSVKTKKTVGRTKRVARVQKATVRKVRKKVIKPKKMAQVVKLPKQTKKAVGTVACSMDQYNFSMALKRLALKFIALFLIVALNWSGLVAIGSTWANFNDAETATDNIWRAGRVNFSLFALTDFSPALESVEATSTRQIDIIDDNSISYEYQVKTANINGDLCDYLEIEAKIEGVNVYQGGLSGLLYWAGLFSTTTDNWEFTASLIEVSGDIWMNKGCSFDLVFSGVQAGGVGFTDNEVISNLVVSGDITPPPPPPPPPSTPCMKINEVYYDPDASHQGPPNENKFEWIELYSACTETINLQNWVLKDNYGTETINQSYDVAPGQFVVLAANAAVWNSYWTLVPDNALKIALGGNDMFGGLSNTGDHVALFNATNQEQDAVSWGTDTYAFTPSVPDVAEGHSIARKVKGVDTDTADDWENLTTPNPGTNPHSMVSLMSLPLLEVTNEDDSTTSSESENSSSSEDLMIIEDLFLVSPGVSDTASGGDQPSDSPSTTSQDDPVILLNPENALSTDPISNEQLQDSPEESQNEAPPAQEPENILAPDPPNGDLETPEDNNNQETNNDDEGAITT